MRKSKPVEAVQMMTLWTRLRRRIGAGRMNRYLVGVGTGIVVLVVVYVIVGDMVVVAGLATSALMVLMYAERGKAKDVE